MDHEERVQLAKKLTNMMIKKYGDDILLSGIGGSTAKNTDTEFSDLEMFFILSNSSKAKSRQFGFAYKGMPVEVLVKKVAEVERDIKEVNIEWPLKMGVLFNMKITCGDNTILQKFRKILESVPQERFDRCIAKETALSYEGLDKIKAVKIRKNTHEIGLFVAEVLQEFNLLVAILNKDFINYDYFGGLFEAFKFKKLPKDYEKIARKLFNWTSLSLDEIISLAQEFVHNFVEYASENGIKIEEHTPLEEVEL